MKLLVTGLVLITLSGVALLWRNGLDRVERIPPVVAEGPERTTHCMVWKVERGHATVWICGSIHLLKESDYPLPAPYQQAFAEAKTVVMERDHSAAVQDHSVGMLSAGETLEQKVSPETWTAITSWCRTSGTDLATMQPLKPWNAANYISFLGLKRLGYSSSMGMESRFSASLDSRKSAGLETLTEQLAAFDQLDAKTQEDMILQAINEEKTLQPHFAAMTAAWYEGDATHLASLMDETMHGFPAVKKLLQDDRNLAWIPKIEAYLDGTEPVMILVGSGHLAGPGNVLELLEKKGVKVTQMEYRTRRLPPSAVRNSG